MADLFLAIIFLVGGIILTIYSSDVAVDHSVKLACKLGASPLIIGMTLVALGTDLPEIINSIMSSYIGHANIDIGDSVGSVLTQLTLVLGLLPFIGRAFKVYRREVLIMGGCLILALVIIMSIVEKGYFTWINGLILMLTFPIYLLLTEAVIDKEKIAATCIDTSLHPKSHRTISYVFFAILGFIGIAIGVYLIINGVLTISEVLNTPDFIISFFILSIGTSLPELVVDVHAIRKGETEVAIGDIMGSCIIDASFAVGIGQFLFPNVVSAELIVPAILYVIIGTVGVITLLVFRPIIDKKSGLVLLIIYGLSFMLLLFLRTAPVFDITSLATLIQGLFR